MRVAVIGLDCAAPRLVFDELRPTLPTISRLMDEGIWGPMRSTDPPITVPAWASMTSGYDAGQLGIYGIRNRSDHSYAGYEQASSMSVKVDRVWDHLSTAGKKVITLGVPPTYPIRPVNGVVVTDWLTPAGARDITHPLELRREIEGTQGAYVLDVGEFRTNDKAGVLKRIFEKTAVHFAVAKHLVTSREWDFFMMVEMGVDRLHHALWGHMDRTHRVYREGNEFEDAIPGYYRYVDELLASLIALLPEDTQVFVVSDHGARRLEGCFCFNQWLVREGLLELHQRPDQMTPLEKLDIDWSKTTAWGDGGFYGRVFMNVKGREPEGTVEPRDYERVRQDIIDRIAAIEDPEGSSMRCRAHRPEELFKTVNGVAPDLIVYFAGLAWRPLGSVGHPSVYAFENDTGPDEANHDFNGIFVAPKPPAALAERERYRIFDVGPTILDMFGLPVPEDCAGRSMLGNGTSPPVGSELL